MKVCHWSQKQLNSGLGHTALHICMAERKLGLDSIMVDAYAEEEWHQAEGADLHVVHLFMPPKVIYKTKAPLVWIAHGTPEVMIESGYMESTKGQYGHADGWMVAQWWLQHADVTVTFWPRHEAIWKSLSDKRARIEGVPLGIDKDFWQPIESQGKYAGEPSVLTAENCYSMKWPLDLFIAWSWVARDFPDAKLHALNVPLDQSRMWFPLINRNGTGFHSYITNRSFSHEELRNAMASTDYYANLVRYADHNYIGLQAAAVGSKVITYKGNPYASFWIEPGDQRVMANQMLSIFRGEVEERRDRERPVDIMRTVECLREVYLSLAKDQPTGMIKKKKIRRQLTKPPSLATATIQ